MEFEEKTSAKPPLADSELFGKVFSDEVGARMSPITQPLINDRVSGIIAGLRDSDYLTREEAQDSLRRGLSGRNQGMYMQALARQLNQIDGTIGEDRAHITAALVEIADSLPAPGMAYRDGI